MRIAILVNQLSGGGAERQAVLWAGACRSLGHEVAILSARRGEGEFEPPAGVRLAYADKRRRTDLPRVWRAIRSLSGEVDLMVAFQYYPAVLAAYPGVDVPFMVVTGDDPRHHWDDHDMPRFLIRGAFRRAAAASAPSRGLVDRYRELGVRPRGPWLCVPNVADDRSFVDGGPERAGALFAGRLTTQKDPLLAVEAALAAGAPLTVLGRGELGPRVEAAARAAGPGAPIALRPYTTEPWREYARHRVLLLTSRFEPFGNVIVESLAAGTPVVAADCDFGPREILAGAAYSHVVPRDRESLAGALRAVLERPYTPDEEAECRRIAARYGRDALTPAIEDALARATAVG